MRVVTIPCLKDNYAYLVICEKSGDAAIVDASEAEPVLAAVKREAVKVVAIWSTHHHLDHVGGNEAVASALGVTDIVGHVSDRGRIPRQSRFVETGQTVSVGTVTAKTVHIPGHTLGAVAYVIEGDTPAVFTGDTLFLAGCGRLFEGTPAQMHASLTTLAALDPKTRVYCGHEYTSANLRFARHVEPSNAEVEKALGQVAVEREAGRASVPGTIGHERAVNPFLRAGSAEIRRTLAIAAGTDDATAFAAIRKAKDDFKG